MPSPFGIEAAALVFFFLSSYLGGKLLEQTESLCYCFFLSFDVLYAMFLQVFEDAVLFFAEVLLVFVHIVVDFRPSRLFLPLFCNFIFRPSQCSGILGDVEDGLSKVKLRSADLQILHSFPPGGFEVRLLKIIR